MVFNGKKLAQKKLKQLKKEVKSKKINLKLDIIYIARNKNSEIYIRNKKKAAENVGIKVDVHTYKSSVTKEVIKATCNNLNFDPNCTGYFFQLPIASKLDKQEILEFISAEKDVDCLTSVNLGKIVMENEDALKPATVEAIISILKELRLKLKSKDITIVNDSTLIGKPLALFLLSKGATVTVCNEFTKDLKEFTKNADILVTATGQSGLIKEDYIKEDAIVIDAGISKKGKKIVGDVEFDSVSKKAKVITPVLGGVGPLTVACLLENLIKLNENKRKQKKTKSSFEL